MIVADECHCITEWGYTFRDAYLHIGDFIGKLKRKPVICACSATISADSLNTIRDSLHMDKPAVLRSDLRRDNLILLKKDVTMQQGNAGGAAGISYQELCKLIDKYHKDGSVLIFAQTTTYVDALYNILEEYTPVTLPLSLTNQAGTPQETAAIRLPARQKKNYDFNLGVLDGY